MILKVAWRNILRNKKRSLLIITSVTVGLFAGIFLLAFYNGMMEQRINTAIQTEISHLQVHHPELKKEYDIQLYLNNGAYILQTIEKKPEVKAATGRMIIKGMIATAAGSSGVSINGIMPMHEQAVTDLSQKLTAGKYLSDTLKNEIFMGEKLANKLKIKLRNKTILTFQNADGNIVSAAFRLVGTYKTVNDPFDLSNVYVHLKEVDTLAGIPHQINEIAVLLHSNKMLEKSQTELKNQFPKTEVQNWMEISPEMGLMVSVVDQMVYIFMGIILLALSFGIVNTMLMAVLERTREIGMLLALGMNKAKLFWMILMETLFLVLAGCPFGIGFALIFIAITKQTGINLNQYKEVYSSFGYDQTIHPSFNPRQLVIIVLLVILTAILSALFPAYKAMQLKPAESNKK